MMRKVAQASDLMVAVAVVIVIVMLVIPLPAGVLDIMIAGNITVALALLLTTMYVPRALDISAFPSLLLLTTMFRLAINVSVTRLILLEGDAGHMVKAFGDFVVGGNVIVGLIIFLVLVIIQFIVVTNGAGRVSEVAARFVLDAMPGKQMAIDADLNSGQITEEQARERRSEIMREADFYGSMDGASKFVKGDAIAALVITAIILLGGITIGVLQQGMPFGEAASTFSLLTIGDGLAAQIPALLISIATGILVTRSSTEGNLGSDISKQLGASPRALMIAGCAAVGFALVPGLPKIPFLLMGSGLILASRYLSKRAADSAVPSDEPAAPQATAMDDDEIRTRRAVSVPSLELVIGVGLIPLVGANNGGSLMTRIGAVRNQIAEEMGVVISSVRVHDDPTLDSHEYELRVRGAKVANAHVVPGHYLAIDSGEALGSLNGIATVEPAYGLAAVWVSEDDRTEAENLSYTVVDAESAIITHLKEVIQRHLGNLLSRQDVRRMLDALKQENSAAVDEVIPELLSVGEVQQVLRLLLNEGVSIRDLSGVLEAIGDAARSGLRDSAVLAERARIPIARTIVQPYLDNGSLNVLALSGDAEQELASAITETSAGPMLALAPQRAERLIDDITMQHQECQKMGVTPAVLCSDRVRRALRGLVVRRTHTIPILSYIEVPDDLPKVVVGQIN